MKTQINNLRSGRKNQVLNPAIDYTQLAPATSHNGHAGDKLQLVSSIWNAVTTENPETLKIKLFGEQLELEANWSLSRKTVTYVAFISKEFFAKHFAIDCSKKNEPYIMIDFANSITAHNGKNSYVGICPSLITIL